MENNELSTPTRATWFRRVFKRKHGEIAPADRIEGSLEATAVSENADKLIEAPREMILPPLTPREQVVREALEPPSAAVLENSPAASWRDHFKPGRKSRNKPADDSLAASDIVTRRPIRLFIGYVPDVTEKDARFFAMGVAEKNVQSEYISYMDLFKFGTGYAYEIQEGGHGHSYLSRILKYFNQLPPALHDAETAVYVATASRMVQVEKTADGGLVCIQLPEHYKAKETDWLRPEKRLKLLRDQNSGLMMISGVFLGVSLLALTGAFLTRYVPRENPDARVWYDTVSMQELPVSQWNSLLNETDAGHYILSLRYTGKEWCKKTEIAETCGSKPPKSISATPAGASLVPHAPASAVEVPAASAPTMTPTPTAGNAAAGVPSGASHPLPPLPSLPSLPAR